jgi:DNA-directed RNA polymerase specialized sigma24 family protein
MRTVYEKYREAEFPRGLLPWVFAILHNKVGNYLKRRRREMRRFVPEDTGTISILETVGVDPDGEIAAIHLSHVLENAFREATPECRKIFRLLLEGAGRMQIQDAFGGELIGTIDSRISRCRARLLTYLEHHWGKGDGHDRS